ncbi:hypothetical protein K438DRAFT_6073 [Mycena galopus ATCC 62051]|nr:hypothetical protein K438DRAFT_6073 [Mycena galopus ATCC 62051]
MSDRHLYSRLLLAKGHGYPLSYPQPPDDLPLETRAKGIQIGDVGVLTTGGGFDTFFNICHPPDDARNRFGVPDGFETVDLDPSKDVWSGERYHRPGSHVSNAKITKRRLQGHTDVDNVFLPLVAGAAIEISTASKQAAVLLMPDGASRLDLRFKEKFRQQALKHARCWYAFLKSLGSMVENGELYLVTGVDNSSSWILGAAENQSQDGNISLKLKAAQIGSTGGSYAWQWEANGAFTDSGPRRPPGEDPRTENQTVFLRGFRIAIHSVAWKKIAQAIPVVDEKRLTFLKKRWFSSFVQSTSLGSISQGSKSTTQIDVPPEEVDTVELSPATVRPYHPADAINNYLLCSTSLSNSDIAAAATHDDEWICALNEDEETLPTETELLKRISGKCTVSFADGGKYFQVIKHESSLDNLTALPHPGSAPPTQGSISSSPVNLGRLSRSLGRLSGSLGVLRLSHLTRPFVQNEMVPPFQPSLDNFKKAYDKYTNPAEIELARAHRRVSAARRAEAEPRDPVCSICFSRCRISPNPWQCTFNDRMELDDSDDEANLKPRKPMTHGLRLASCKHYFCGVIHYSHPRFMAKYHSWFTDVFGAGDLPPPQPPI